MESSPRAEGHWPRRVLAGISLLVVSALFVPALSGQDSFPLSTQPMYADVRPAVETFVTARGLNATGMSIALTMREIADTDDPLIARQRTRAAARDGAAELESLCDAIITRLPTGTEIEAVEIIEVRVDVVDFARTGSSESRVLTRCERP